MKSSWIAGAIGTVPPTPGSFSNGYPTDGNPSTAVPPTEPGAWWFYMVTQEIVNAVTAAGLTPSATVLNQLTLAIQALAASASPVQSVNGRTGAVTGVVDTASFTSNQSLGANGYQLMPGGLIVQWGSVLDDGNTKSFPMTFPNACYVVVGTPSLDAFDNTSSINAHIVSTSQFRLRNGGAANLAGDGSQNFYIAIGS